MKNPNSTPESGVGEAVGRALDAVIAPYRSELQTLSPGERILLSLSLSESARTVAKAIERARAGVSRGSS